MENLWYMSNDNMLSGKALQNVLLLLFPFTARYYKVLPGALRQETMTNYLC